MNGHPSDEDPVFNARYLNDNRSKNSYRPRTRGISPTSATRCIPPSLMAYWGTATRPCHPLRERVYHHLQNQLAQPRFQKQHLRLHTQRSSRRARARHKYTFYNGPGTGDPYGTYNVSVAPTLQHHITSFAMTGTPNDGSMYPTFPLYGAGTLLNLTDFGFPTVADPTANERCLYWQQEPYKSSLTPLKNASANGWSTLWGGELSKMIGAMLAGLVVL